jgi:hypothetical protein
MEDKELFSSLQNGALFGLKDRDVKSITIPDEARYICKGTFMGCPNLQTVYIPKSVEEIAGVAFMNCKNLKNVEIQGDVHEVSSYAFQGTDNLRILAFNCKKVKKNRSKCIKSISIPAWFSVYILKRINAVNFSFHLEKCPEYNT